MRVRVAVLGALLTIATIGAPATATRHIRIVAGGWDDPGGGCLPTEVWKDDTKVASIDTSGGVAGTCFELHQVLYVGELAYFSLVGTVEDCGLLFGCTYDTVGSVYVTDGTESGTSPVPVMTGICALQDYSWLVVDACGSHAVATRGVPPSIVDLPGSPGEFVRVGEHMLFAGRATDVGRELWRTDGSTVKLVKDIRPGSRGSRPDTLRRAGDGVHVRFYADDGTGRACWSTDGTRRGTRRIGKYC